MYGFLSVVRVTRELDRPLPVPGWLFLCNSPLHSGITWPADVRFLRGFTEEMISGATSGNRIAQLIWFGGNVPPSMAKPRRKNMSGNGLAVGFTILIEVPGREKVSPINLLCYRHIRV